MARALSLYDFPDVYDLVLRSPPDQIATEVDSIRKLLAGRGIHAGRILELACGTCAHSIELARRGFDVAGIDRSPRMLEGARRAATSAGVRIELHEGDIVDFDLGAEPFDGVIFMSETFPLITEYDDIRRHFRAVRRHLKKGGLYVIDIDAFRHYTASGIWGQKRFPLGEGSVEVWHEDFPGDWVRGTSRMTLYCRIHRGESTEETADEWEFRRDSPWHLSVLIKTLADWSLTGFFSWHDLSPEIAAEDHYFMVLE